jgi:hypothetical protein
MTTAMRDAAADDELTRATLDLAARRLCSLDRCSRVSR